MADLDYIIHQIRSEIKVNPSNGHGTCSIRGTARLGKISISTLVESLQTGDRIKPSKLCQYLIRQGFDSDRIINFGKTGIPDLAVAAILEYYAYEAGERSTKQAMLVCRAFLRVGVRSWMQDLAGYQKPIDQKIDIREFVIKQLPETPKKWERRFKPEFWGALERLYGLKREKRACAIFINHWVYNYFPSEVLDRIDEINPLDSKGYRPNKNHQHFHDALDKALDMQISLVTCNLIKAESRKHFKELMRSAKRYKFTMTNLNALQGSN
jgi:hypothetical protein